MTGPDKRGSGYLFNEMHDLHGSLWAPLLLLSCIGFVVFIKWNPIRWLNRVWLTISRSEIVYDLNPKEKIVGFFHPYCDSGGGGERVLWVMIDAMLHDSDLRTRNRICLYTASTATKDSILNHVKSTFGIDLCAETLSNRIHFVRIRCTTLLEARWYPVATMIGQSLGSVIVGLECLKSLVPDIYIDTTGAPFTYPIFASLAYPCQVIAYVHYPLISTDMLQRVREFRPSYNNNVAISGSTTVSNIKILYYHIFAWMYGMVGSFASMVYVNSSWTEGHVAEMWRLQRHTNGTESESLATSNKSQRNRNALQVPPARTRYANKLFPPCNTSVLSLIRIDTLRDGCSSDSHINRPNTRFVLSVGQFRPEKDHMLQLRAFAKFCKKYYHDRPKSSNRLGRPAPKPTVQLVLLGSTRNLQDEQLVTELRAEASRLGIQDDVQFVVNASFVHLQAWLAAASVGLHTIWNEHFGISVVEMMAAGLIVVAHNSGGPRSDIICPPSPMHDEAVSSGATLSQHTGYLATTSEEYADCIARALQDGDALPASAAEDNMVRRRARDSVLQRFSDDAFSRKVREDFAFFL